MRLLFHPALSDITVEGILYALSDPVRAQIYWELAASECARNCSNFRKLDNRTLPKSTLSQHFKILREAGLIRSERKGVEMHNTIRWELKERFGDMLSAIANTYAAQNSRRPHSGVRSRADGSFEPSITSRKGKKTS
ncbi:MAG: helix-turn-helix transcriptional regulator [Verrucomicrobia bacterium]|nr:helix-turn-helix transcriptional regulator [Verrucomicrobiota bacterium]